MIYVISTKELPLYTLDLQVHYDARLPADQVESWQPPLDGKKVPRILEVDEVGLKNFDALGLDRGRDHVSLQVDTAGWKKRFL